MKKLCQSGDFKTAEILRFGSKVTKSHNDWWTSFQNGFIISFSLHLKYSFPKSHTDFIEHWVDSLKRFTHEEFVCRILRIHVSFSALTKDEMWIIRHPAFLWSWHKFFLAILSTFPLHINCAKSLSKWVISSEEGFGKLINRWVTFDNSSVLTTVILPNGVRFLLDQWLISFLIILILLSKFIFSIFSSWALNLTPRIVKSPELLKLASEASQENFGKKCVFNHKIWANSEIRTFALPKSGGHKPTCLLFVVKYKRTDAPSLWH